MISINFRRGLFRLWIAASVVWLVGAGVVWQKDIRRDVSTLMTAESLQEKRLIAKALQDELRASLAGQEDSSASPYWTAVAEGIERGISRTELEELYASLAVPKDTRTPSQRAQDSLTFAASAILLPPILLFALGWAGLWIAASLIRSSLLLVSFSSASTSSSPCSLMAALISAVARLGVPFCRPPVFLPWGMSVLVYFYTGSGRSTLCPGGS